MRFSDTAMVLAAGLGKRLRPLTLEKPKPLFDVGGRTMLDLAIDKLRDAGMKRVVVNTFYLAPQIEEHLKQRRDVEIIISREEELLETGGGIKKALAHFGGNPFFALNADLPWLDGPKPSLQKMMAAWDPLRMDAALLVMPTKKARGAAAAGDFVMEEDGQIWRKDAPVPKPYVFIGAQILKPELFEGVQEKVFSNNRIYDIAEDRRRLYGVIHEGACYHVGTPEDLAEANRLLATKTGWAVVE